MRDPVSGGTWGTTPNVIFAYVVFALLYVHLHTLHTYAHTFSLIEKHTIRSSWVSVMHIPNLHESKDRASSLVLNLNTVGFLGPLQAVSTLTTIGASTAFTFQYNVRTLFALPDFLRVWQRHQLRHRREGFEEEQPAYALVCLFFNAFQCVLLMHLFFYCTRELWKLNNTVFYLPLPANIPGHPF